MTRQKSSIWAVIQMEDGCGAVDIERRRSSKSWHVRHIDGEHARYANRRYCQCCYGFLRSEASSCLLMFCHRGVNGLWRSEINNTQCVKWWRLPAYAPRHSARHLWISRLFSGGIACLISTILMEIFFWRTVLIRYVGTRSSLAGHMCLSEHNVAKSSFQPEIEIKYKKIMIRFINKLKTSYFSIY